MERTIRVTGKGRISVKPDRIQLGIEASGIYKEYTESVKKSAEDTALIREALTKAGLDPHDLKTDRFSVDIEKESYQDNRNNWKKRFVGYKYDHDMHIIFPNDNKILGKVLYELSVCPAKVECSIRYTVQDTEIAKNTLLERTIADSKKKATLLTKAAGVKLGDIVTIDYSWGKLEIYSHTMDKMTLCDSPIDIAGDYSYDIDVEADNIEVEDIVTVVWEIR